MLEFHYLVAQFFHLPIKNLLTLSRIRSRLDLAEVANDVKLPPYLVQDFEGIFLTATG